MAVLSRNMKDNMFVIFFQSRYRPGVAQRFPGS